MLNVLQNHVAFCVRYPQKCMGIYVVLINSRKSQSLQHFVKCRKQTINSYVIVKDTRKRLSTYH